MKKIMLSFGYENGGYVRTRDVYQHLSVEDKLVVVDSAIRELTRIKDRLALPAVTAAHKSASLDLTTAVLASGSRAPF